MDGIIKYLIGWKNSQKVFGRLEMLIKTYNLVSKDERLSSFKFSPGKRRTGRNPMYCAFAATSFAGEDYFILRLVKRQSDKFSIGFCPDYGKQDKKDDDIKPFRERRKQIEQAIKEVKKENPKILNKVPFPETDAKGRTHAYKGFERKVIKPKTAEDLAEEFIITVLEWQELFKRII
ncbi:hypothetical protein [Selenihalanaerobacter shriftii]|uniref:Uncharacterized protein n=1 Tax=Selenihalanaerobacter shriftii TaxID=142842 RepID=A0A1T4NGU3_9FIRM|nr:hypothetical protein [Selenihalanaerobacter shriftii]SJZ77958.1 hypothetical protein SAMN02745118_01795 [Selenihalanaerobacter shriftii]